jgi:molecular chaperone DnaK
VSAIETALNELKEAHKAENLAGIETASASLNAAWQAASQDMYQATQEQQAGAGGDANGHDAGQAGDATSKDDVTDVEFEEVGK